MNRGEIVAIIARQSELQPPDVDSVIKAFVDILALNLQVGESVTIRGLGRFDPKTRPSATLRHPRTGAPITTGDRRTVAFRPSMLLKDRLNATPFLTGTDPNRHDPPGGVGSDRPLISLTGSTGTSGVSAIRATV